MGKNKNIGRTAPSILVRMLYNTSYYVVLIKCRFNCTTNNFGTPKIALMFLLIILIISMILQARFSGDVYDKRKKYSVPCSARHGIYRGKSHLKQALKFTLYVAFLCH